MKEDIFKYLNEKQREAVSCSFGPSIILAGAGSGKTRVLVYKVIYLIKNQNVNPQSIIMITFTNKAGDEMKERIVRIAQVENLGFIGTFHSFCASILRKFADYLGYENNYVIYDEDDQKSLIKEVIKNMAVKKYTPDFFLNQISLAKNRLITPEKYLDIFNFGEKFELIKSVYEKYQKKLKKHNAMDFDDLLLNVIFLWRENKSILELYQNKISQILVDEFQDTNVAQYELIKMLAKKNKNITVVGDFSQSIYSWRGADIENLKKFQKDFPEAKVFYLDENYRSTQKILDFAYKIIVKNVTHPILYLKSGNQEGEEITFYEAENEEDEAIYVTNQIIKLTREGFLPNQIAVLYRINAQSRIIEEAFLHYGLPYILIGGIRFYERKEIKDVLSFLRVIVNEKDEVALKRIINLGKKRFNKFNEKLSDLKEMLTTKTTDEIIEEVFEITNYLDLYDLEDPDDYSRIENIKELKSVALNFPNINDFLQQVALVEQEYYEGEKKNKDKEGVRLMTLHAAKGLEFEVVFIIGVEDGILPHSRCLDDLYSIEEERRLFYVGITRAKKKLFVTFTRKRFLFGSRTYSLKSRFLEE
ncbi:MAG: ATP-dependent helicase [Microgenomates group bacterium]